MCIFELELRTVRVLWVISIIYHGCYIKEREKESGVDANKTDYGMRNHSQQVHYNRIDEITRLNDVKSQTRLNNNKS